MNLKCNLAAVVFCFAFLGLSHQVAAATEKTDDGQRDCASVYVSSIFEPRQWPDRDLASFASGNLGVIQPTYDHFFLFLAYRALAGLPVTPANLDSLRKHDPCWVDSSRDWHGFNLSQSPDWQRANRDWIAGATLIAGEEKPAPKQYRHERRDAGALTTPDANCNADAFRKASETLSERLAQHGRDQYVSNWVAEQRSVFRVCDGKYVPPKDAPFGAPRWLRLDREYQQAAALFYGGYYDEAVKRFDAISAMTDSPWRVLTPYLAARALLRKGSAKTGNESAPLPPEFAMAETRLREIIASPAAPNVKANALALLKFARLRTAPVEMRAELDQRMRALELDDAIGQDVTDFWFAHARAKTPADPDTFAGWLMAMRGEGASNQVFERWQRSGSLLWLMASLVRAEPSSADSGALVIAARAIPRSSPAYVMANYHLLRLTADDGAAAGLAEKLLALPREMASRQDANRIKRAVLSRAQSSGQFIRFAHREAVSEIYGKRPFVAEDGALALNSGMPLDVLVGMSRSKSIPPGFRDELSVVVWVRAYILRRWDVVSSLAPEIVRIVPAAKTLIVEMQRENDSQTREAIGAMLLSRYPGMAANVRSVIEYTGRLDMIARTNVRRTLPEDGTRDNWWCGLPDWSEVPDASDGNRKTRGDRAPSIFFAPKDVTALLRERERLDTTANGTEFLGGKMMRWARIHPRDERLAQGLHMIVRSTRGGCLNRSSNALSVAAFRHLHRNFAGNEWTKKTRVHYGYGEE